MVMSVTQFQMCICVPNCIEVGWFFVEICRFNDLQNGGRAPSWIFETYSLCVSVKDGTFMHFRYLFSVILLLLFTYLLATLRISSVLFGEISV